MLTSMLEAATEKHYLDARTAYKHLVEWIMLESKPGLANQIDRMALTPSDDKRRPDATPCIKAVAKDLALMHKQLQPLLSRSHLQTVFARVLAAFDEGLLSAYQAINTSALFTRQCIVADVLFLWQDISKLHLALPHMGVARN